MVYLSRSRAIYPNGRPERYVRALFAMANDADVRRRTAWLIEQRSRFWARPRDIVLHCMNVAAGVSRRDAPPRSSRKSKSGAGR